MDNDLLRIALIPFGAWLLYQVVIIPIKNLVNNRWPDNKIKRFLFKDR